MDRLGTVAVVGVGLIGGSIGLALRARGLAAEVVGVGRDLASLQQARERGVIDRATTDLSRGVAEADVVVVCTPVGRIAEDVRHAAELAPRSALITDAGSTKRGIVEAVERSSPRAAEMYVAAHPLAGSERSGSAFARADLYQDRVCVLTPTARTASDRLRRAREFWAGLGCRIVEMGPAEHDEVVAYTSHLPHALAASLAAAVPADWHPLAAGAFRDGTRVAGADTELWTAIFRDNRGPLMNAVAKLQDRLSSLKYALMNDDEESIRRWWSDARARRLLFEAQQPPEA
ncbi:prephenate dehydrogenase [Paludisphaera mucosa]|uniref:Prephenate dehydrogenase n=1 Tax=Paludisphaera mucosa TaxID=3030827 RepID=A0ABT6F7G5_9BACT|nr:prephenate dehydrogenase [Paludisphaera mucosa]MDG3003364.1 prephenate dehydrogenase [Paludisphaera mucosa]